MLLVPDASVLLKWVLPAVDEPGAELALALRDAWLNDACELAVPTLWLYEVGNTLCRRQPAAAGELLDAMVALGLPEHGPHTYLKPIVDLVQKHHVTFYDAAYHALAILRGGTMVTADEVYVRRAKRAGHVQLLADWRR